MSVERARADLAAFAELIGQPLRPAQAAGLRLDVRTTVIVAPRQTGKSYSLAVLALWWAFRLPRQRVLLVSAGEDASRRLLSTIRGIAAQPLLAGSVLDESTALLVLSNGSEVRSVPASEKQIRGWSVDLLIVDEAALVPDDLLYGAGIPTTAARPDARIVLASTPWATDGAFYRYALAGLEPNEHTRTHRWSLADAPWITASVIEHARATLPDLRFRAEFEGEFVGAADGYFDPRDLLAAVADYALLPAEQADGEAVTIGLDWGRAFDRHAVVALGVLDDHATNPQPVLFLPWVETSSRPYAEQVEAVVALARPRRPSVRFWRGSGEDDRSVQPLPNGGTLWEGRAGLAALIAAERAKRRPRVAGFEIARCLAEANGVGAMPSEQLGARMGRRVVEAVHTSQRSKEDAYGRVRALLAQRRLVLPDMPELLRQLRGISYEATQSGMLSIAAANPAVHDDLADALSLAVAAAPPDMDPGITTPEPPGAEWLSTPGGVRVPSRPRPRRGGLGARRAVLRAFD